METEGSRGPPGCPHRLAVGHSELQVVTGNSVDGNGIESLGHEVVPVSHLLFGRVESARWHPMASFGPAKLPVVL